MLGRVTSVTIELTVKRLDSELPLPSYAHQGDAGLDLYSAEDVELRPGHRALIRTGIAVAIPEGYAG
ncbi:MAG: dUTP diphosphatase, partial [Actinobacteria bacterium HGW-Actinobacteria-8]